MVGTINDKGSLRAKHGLPILAALGLHAALLALVLGYRPPPAGRLRPQTEVFLMSAKGLANAMPAAIKTVQPDQPSKAPAEAAAPPLQKPPSLPPASTDDPSPAGPSDLAPSPEGRIGLPALVAAGPSSGPDVTAAPLPVKVAAAAASASASATATTLNGSTKTCEILETLNASLNASPGVHAELAVIPRQARSVSNAMLLWNGRWLEIPSEHGASPLELIERLVKEAIETSPAACTGEVLHGPRLILVAELHDTFVLAFGSGDWRWTDLLDQPTLSALK